MGKCLRVPCETRWNSKYDAIKLCMEPELQKKMNTLIQELKTNLVTNDTAKNLQLLTNADFAILAIYLKVLEPVAQSLDIMQRETNSSQGLIIPVLLSMKGRIQQIDDSSNIAKDFKNAMLDAIKNRTQQYIDIHRNEDLLLAALSLLRVKANISFFIFFSGQR